MDRPKKANQNSLQYDREGSIKLGPVTAPIVEPHTTSDNCFARFDSVAKSIAAKRA